MEPLENISRQFEKQNAILQQMLDIMPRPGNRLVRFLEMMMLIAGAGGVLTFIHGLINFIMEVIK